MSRPLRIEYAEAMYHVTSRGDARRPIFKDNKNRPRLTEIFKNTGGERRRRDRGIAEAVRRWGYSEREVADTLRLHYSTVSRLIRKGADSKTSKSKA
jgi:hypothetical protein